MNILKSKILNLLLDNYEKSKTFIGENKNKQSFKISVSKLFPKYDDDSDYEFYKSVNDCISFLEFKNFITVCKERSGKVKSISLNVDNIDECYSFLSRKPKTKTNEELLKLWENFKSLSQEKYSPLLDYLQKQESNLIQNKNISLFDGDLKTYTDLLLAVKSVLGNDNETYIREFSIKVFNDSKKLENIEGSVRSLLYNYGDYDDKDTVLEEHNIIKTPTYVMVKGCGILDFGEQQINLSQLPGDIGLSTKTLLALKAVTFPNEKKCVITIENLTTFHKYESNGELVVYLGGFHNQVKRDFIRLVEKCNADVSFYHFGDIDAGGFYILEHLKKKTGIDFYPKFMDVATLIKHEKYWSDLTENDKKRLNDLLKQHSQYNDVISFMLENNCRLEQEAVRLSR